MCLSSQGLRVTVLYKQSTLKQITLLHLTSNTYSRLCLMKQIYCHAELAILSEPIQSSSEGWAAFKSPMLIFGFFIIFYLDSKK